MVQFLGTLRPSPSFSSFATYKRQEYSPITAPNNGVLSIRRMFKAYLQSSSAATDAGSGLPLEQSEVIFIGTGTSEGIPRVSCLTNPLKKCEVCLKAVEPGNRNRRLNTSIVVRHPTSSGSSNILLMLENFSITVLSDGFLLMGLDDLRDWTNNVQPSIPIYVPERDFEVMKKTHYYLVDTSVVQPGAAVSELQFNIIQEDPFSVNDLKFTPLPVWHGRGYRSFGYRFGNVCYISDVSEIPEETYPLLRDCELLIMDAYGQIGILQHILHFQGLWRK